MTRTLIAALIAVAALSATAATSSTAEAGGYYKHQAHYSYYKPVVRHYHVVKPVYHKVCAVWTSRGHCLRWY
jgi:hypothetical protein